VAIPVVEGFTVGIAIIIGLQQLPAALGIQVKAEKVFVLAGQSSQTWAADPRHLFDTTPEAIAHARLHAARVLHSPWDGAHRAT
jgi:MFS superfamily sulfate permease-like transporter